MLSTLSTGISAIMYVPFMPPFQKEALRAGRYVTYSKILWAVYGLDVLHYIGIYRQFKYNFIYLAHLSFDLFFCPCCHAASRSPVICSIPSLFEPFHHRFIFYSSPTQFPFEKCQLFLVGKGLLGASETLVTK